MTMAESRQIAGLTFLFALACGLLMAMNLWTQPLEEGLQLVPRGMPYWKDWIWYLDDILAPAAFLAGGITFYFGRVAWRGRFLETWPLAVCAAVFVGFALVDTLDAHWVPATQIASLPDLTNVTSNLSKLLLSIAVVFVAIYSAPWLRGRARRALYFVAFLMVVDLQTLSIWLDFAGLAFHIFEEALELVAGLVFAFGVALDPLRDPPDPD